jgi:hypothetical protein
LIYAISRNLDIHQLKKLKCTLSSLGHRVNQWRSEEDVFVVDVGQEVVDDQVLVVDELEHNSDVRLKINISNSSYL